MKNMQSGKNPFTTKKLSFFSAKMPFSSHCVCKHSPWINLTFYPEEFKELKKDFQHLQVAGGANCDFIQVRIEILTEKNQLTYTFPKIHNPVVDSNKHYHVEKPTIDDGDAHDEYIVVDEQQVPIADDGSDSGYELGSSNYDSLMQVIYSLFIDVVPDSEHDEGEEEREMEREAEGEQRERHSKLESEKEGETEDRNGGDGSEEVLQVLQDFPQESPYSTPNNACI